LQVQQKALNFKGPTQVIFSLDPPFFALLKYISYSSVNSKETGADLSDLIEISRLAARMLPGGAEGVYQGLELAADGGKGGPVRRLRVPTPGDEAAQARMYISRQAGGQHPTCPHLKQQGLSRAVTG
jgi:hypothetical protein